MNVKPEIATVVAMDRVGASLLPIEAKLRLSRELTEAVQASPSYQDALKAAEVIPLDSGDGMALVFFGDPARAAQCALEIDGVVRPGTAAPLRIGLHTGPVARRQDAAMKANVDGAGIDVAFRVMSVADGSEVMVSAITASMLSGYEAWSSRLSDLGERTVKHGQLVRVYAFREPSPAGFVNLNTGTRRVVVVYKRNSQPDGYLLDTLERELVGDGHRVFIDRHLSIGMAWAQSIEREVRDADAVVVLLSDRAAGSEMVLYEVQTALNEMDRRGRPWILPVRVGTPEPVAGEMAGLLGRFQYRAWLGAADDARLLQDIRLGLANPPHTVEPVAPLEQAGGAVPLSSPYYIVRPSDHELLEAVRRQDSIVLVKGARQMGKTSILARGVQLARDEGSRIALTDFQTFSGSQLESDERLYRSLAHSLASQLGLHVDWTGAWNEWLGPNTNLEQFIQDQILDQVDGHVVWAMDEVDRLFTRSYAGDFFGMVRSWHNRRALDPHGPWSRLTLAIVYATEAHLFISDLNQSPFNVGTRLTLDDLRREEVDELNRRYGSPLRAGEEVDRLIALVSGHPFLMRRAMDEMVRRTVSIDQLEKTAALDEGIFGDHLRRLLVALGTDEGLAEAVRGMLRGQTPANEAFFRLRSAGLIAGDNAGGARFRCAIYADYLRRHLLETS